LLAKIEEMEREDENANARKAESRNKMKQVLQDRKTERASRSKEMKCMI
jgi:hypothetical protein